MRVRQAARIILLDDAERVLLFRFQHRAGPRIGQFGWIAPGGALKPGESFEAAALRELKEETGVIVSALGAAVDERRFTMHLPDGETVLAHEQFFLLRSPQPVISKDGWSAQEHEQLLALRWWSAAEIAAAEHLFPNKLLALLMRLTDTRPCR